MNVAATIKNDTITNAVYEKSNRQTDSRQQLYSAILAGIEDVKAGNIIDADDALDSAIRRVGH